MKPDIAGNLFNFFAAELVVIAITWLLKGDTRKLALVFFIGTISAGWFAFGPKIEELFSDANVQEPIQQTPELLPQFQQIALNSWSELSEPETNLGLTPGLHDLLDIPFSTGWKASTQCSHLPNQPQSFRLETDIAIPDSVYLLIQAGWGLTRYAGYEIGDVTLTFSDNGSTHTYVTPLILGNNIRDWAWQNPQAIITTQSPASQPAWEGVTPDGIAGGMDILTINIPGEYKNSRLTSIDISDWSQQTIGDINPCIHLVALTVKYYR